MKTLQLKYYLLLPLSILLLTAILQPSLLLAADSGSVSSMEPDSRMTFPALLEATDRVELHAQVVGYLDSIEFIEGALVKRGDVLFKVDPRIYAARSAEAEAVLSVAISESELAQSEADRARRLFQRNAIPAEEVERRNSQLLTALAKVKTAEANKLAADLNLQFTEIRAPIDGRIGRALLTPGNLVTVSDTLAVIVAIDKLYVRFDMAEHEFARANQYGRDQWILQFSNDAQPDGIIGEVAIIDNEVRKGTGSVRIFGRIDNPSLELLPGMFGKAELVLSEMRGSNLIIPALSSNQ